MDKAQKINLGISTAQTIILALTLWFAVQIGMTQNSINQSMLGVNYEPSIALSFQSSTPNNSGLVLTNNGKTNITFYTFAAISASTTPEKEVVVPSDTQQTIGPGQAFYIPKRVQDPDFATMFAWFVTPNTKKSLQTDIFFKTADNIKYIYRTIFSLQKVNNLGILTWTPGTYEQYNWSEK